MFYYRCARFDNRTRDSGIGKQGFLDSKLDKLYNYAKTKFRTFLPEKGLLGGPEFSNLLVALEGSATIESEASTCGLKLLIPIKNKNLTFSEL